VSVAETQPLVPGPVAAALARVRWLPTWPHVNLGISVHIDRKYGHVSFHLPIGVIVIGFTGDDPGS
jgi:hypothetical protein